MGQNVNALNETWIAAGQKVSDLQAKAQAMVDDDTVTAEEVATIKNDIENAKAKRDLAHENLVNAQAEEIVNTEVHPLDKEEKDQKRKFVDEFKDYVNGIPNVVNEVNSSTDEGGNRIGLTIPQDIETAIHALVRQYESLQELVNVEHVTTSNGSRVYEKWTDVTPLTNLDNEDDLIGDIDDPKLTLVKYLIKRYAGIQTITNSLLKDTAENILAWLSQWIAKKVTITRNAAIIEQMKALPKKPTIAKFDDIKDMVNVQLDPAITTTSIFITNQSGYGVLAKVKDAFGNYLLQHDPTQPDVHMIDGKTVKVVSDKWLPDLSGSHPLYFGDLKQAITLFDREQMSLLSTNVGAGAFERDQTKIRVIDRFDVRPTDTDAVIAGSFKEVADQKATTSETPKA